MEQWRRIALLIIGLTESIIFSGIVFGWANLLYILQEEGVYSYLCVNNVAEATNLLSEELVREDKYIVSPLASHSLEAFKNSTQDLELLEELGNRKVTELTLKCAEQGNTFTLIYTVAATMYGLTSVFIGFSLDYFGLWATRISGSVMTFTGFFCLVFTTRDESWLLWPALNLIALGTNQLKLCSYQFINLWPTRRSTILFAYGAAFSISATVFTLLQYLYTSGISYRAITLPLAVLSVFTLPVTFLMPIMKVKEYVKTRSPEDIKAGPNPKTINEETTSLNPDKKSEVNGDMAVSVETHPNLGLDASKKIEIPLSSSLLSVSAALHVLWHFINFFMILFYSLSFNAWVYKSTPDSDQVAHYTQVMGICQLTGPLFTPLTGLFTDLRIKAAQKYPDPVKRLMLTIQAPAFSTAMATLCLTALMTCKMFVNKPAIYASMVLVAICRPLVHSSCVSYIRLRFPADHFNRLNGIFTTIVALVMFVQYPIFLWMFSSDKNYDTVGKVLLLSLILSLISPGHMMITKFAKRFAIEQLRVGVRKVVVALRSKVGDF
ncbi:unnamed protein product [Allacma fusca]|uniref:Uncharacterized protein n=1 Tax=Allacma fusca TaxID=39272 RepID=A0A8J2P1Q3_9HEXA|nr:unnamed protein product [Allacma fusca]